VSSSQLPVDFANIPEADPAGAVLASVAGTPQAGEAAVSATIPQTATVARTATTSVSYSGAPEFHPIEKTSLSYAVNTATPVIKVADASYYSVVNGVWFVASSADGPWAVADSVHPAIYTIPPSCPVYYASHVFVYGSTPDVVYTGYTPGYFGPCISPEGVVVFGTGYWYPPFIGPDIWIGPPLTYGFGAGFACGLATGFAFGLAADHGWGCSPYWGPWHGGWGNNNRNWNNVNVNSHNVYNRWSNNVVNNNHVNIVNNSRINNNRINNNRINNVDNSRINNSRINNVDNRANDVNRASADAAARNDASRIPSNPGNWKNDAANRVNNDRTDVAKPVDRQSIDPSRLGGNNVFAGKDGQAYRARSDGGWEQHSGASWSKPESFDRGVHSDLDQQRSSRSVGATRSFGGGGGFRR
jgi:hypothetical protein